MTQVHKVTLYVVDHDAFGADDVKQIRRRLLRLPYCAVICHQCKQITGWENP